MESNPGQSTPPSTPSSLPPAPDFHWEPWPPALIEKTLRQGMAAFKQKQYDQAIALLEPILKQVQQPKTIAQVYKILAKAYMAQKNTTEALQYCQALQQHPDPTVQQWATKAIAHLQQHPPLNRAKPRQPATPMKTTTRNGVRDLNIARSPITNPTAPPAQDPTAAVEPPVARASPPPPPVPPEEDPAAALADPGFKPLSPNPSRGSASTSSLTEWLSQREHVPAASQEPSRLATTPASPPPDISPPPLPPTVAHQQTEQTDGVAAAHGTLIQPDPLAQDFPADAGAEWGAKTGSTRLSAVAIASLPWKQADRAHRWSPIPIKLTITRRINTVLTYAWTAIALWGIATLFLRIGMVLGNPIRELISTMVRFNRWYFLEYYPGRVAAIVLGGLLLLAPLILHVWLCWGYKTRPFALNELGRHSPEAEKLLQRSCKKHKHPLPRLRRIATQTPVLLSYGWRPRCAWIVVSDGLLRQLNDDEIAALYGAELSHIRQWSLGLITAFTLATQISYGIYQGFAHWGDRRKNSLLQWLGATGAAIAYGMFWLVRHAGLWLARSRHHHSDRSATNLTGNPNGLVRGLLKFAIATATDIRRQGKTEPILEQFEWLMPVGYRSAISAGSVFPIQWQAAEPEQAGTRETPPHNPHNPNNEVSRSLEATVLTWDYRNAYRDWMAFNNTHPPLGDRLYTLTRYAQHWRLEPELSLPALPRLSNAQKMQRQMAPFFGLPIGAGLSILLWILGLVANHFNWPIAWLRDEAVSIFWGMLAMGFSFGTILRMNAFFPDLPASSQPESDLADLLTDPDRLPIDSQPIHLEGKLLGRKGVGNWLNQDLMLQTQTGIVRLHCISMLGTLGHLLFDVIRLNPLKGRTVTVTGWLRRGATPWIDVSTIQSQRGKPIQGGHPIWSTLLAGGLTLWGAYILYQTNL